MFSSVLEIGPYLHLSLLLWLTNHNLWKSNIYELEYVGLPYLLTQCGAWWGCLHTFVPICWKRFASTVLPTTGNLPGASLCRSVSKFLVSIFQILHSLFKQKQYWSIINATSFQCNVKLNYVRYSFCLLNTLNANFTLTRCLLNLRNKIQCQFKEFKDRISKIEGYINAINVLNFPTVKKLFQEQFTT